MQFSKGDLVIMKNIHIMAKDIFSICAIKVAKKDVDIAEISAEEKKFEDCRGKVKPF